MEACNFVQADMISSEVDRDITNAEVSNNVIQNEHTTPTRKTLQLDPNEPIISPKSMRVVSPSQNSIASPGRTHRKQRAPEYSTINTSSGSGLTSQFPTPNKHDMWGSRLQTPTKNDMRTSLLFKQFLNSQNVVSNNFLNCEGTQQTRMIRTEPLGQTLYSTVPIVSLI